MTGNYVYGLGEQLVSGEVNANNFKLIRPKGKYEGPETFKNMHQMSVKREREHFQYKKARYPTNELIMANPSVNPNNLMVRQGINVT
ncbi:MAG: hypothetical protein VR72_10445 [Clostridiaceae bacterium BRH_c20a]|nr:MAG: hypothetical protein VR72_10445 [Clostridiaceae bacterium BRH_c20a]